MKIYKCKLCGDELCTDAYPMEVVDDVMYKFEGKFVAKVEGGDYGIGGDEEEGVADPNTVHVVDIVDASNLVETQYDKKSYMMHIKMYMKKLKAKLEAEDPERVAPFMKGAQAFVKKLIGDFKEYQFFTGSSMDPESTTILCKYEGETPYFYIWKDGCEEEKY
eukprot:CAMPEP_0174247078 /NCGR_PEP_ID=MMETSP0417-20130205/42391_1 /TAXON_ID=242541 /ORGANISM="Mayorella sp, Strain BSH-02190019" /LENGTH=162 /DNA_ID=CAMNT_0015326931 /DNA_START=44 /DNA_END=532 /DNA_ORIENTATION=-